jgi:predicted amidophosphoribosyltransferase
MLFTESCAGCSAPGETLCRRCRFALVSAPQPHLAGCVRAALPFDGVARQAILGLKYRNRRRVAAVLAEAVVRRLALQRDHVDLVTWAPTGATRAAGRGFDQSEILARAIARQLGVPCRRLLYRCHGPAQTGRTRAERLGGPAFRGRAVVPAPRVLLVDDVHTTGATLTAALQALAAGGVADVVPVAVAAAGTYVGEHVRHVTPDHPSGARAAA